MRTNLARCALRIAAADGGRIKHGRFQASGVCCRRGKATAQRVPRQVNFRIRTNFVFDKLG